MMGRTTNKGLEPVEDLPLDTQVLVAQQNQVAILNDEQDAMVRAVAEQIGYSLPAECTSPDLIQRDIAANMRRSVEACLEVGRGLQVLKLACAHGEFGSRLEALGLDRTVAARFMASAAKFASIGSNSAVAKAIGSQTKLFEMLVLDDGELQELELTGQTGELSLDDVATMSVKELRQALRAAREDKNALAQVAASKNAKIDELATQLAKQPRVQTVAPDEIAKELRVEVIGLAFEAEADITGKLRQGFIKLAEHAEEHGADHRPFKAGLIAQLENLLAGIRSEFGLPDHAGAEQFGWLQEAAAQEA